MRHAPSRLLAVALVASLSFSTIAGAQVSAVDRATAQSLFDEARSLMDAGKFTEACPKFAESLRFDAGLGTMLRLGDCYEKSGQIASAWAMFLDATEAARKTGDPREKVARSHVEALAPRVSKLTVHVAEPRAPGLVVKRDGEAIGAALFGTAAPIDPGTHTIDASAPGKKPWRGTVEVPAGGGVASINVPALVELAAVPAPQTSPSESAMRTPAKTPPARSKAPALVLGGVGVAAVATGVILFLGAKSKHDTAASQCTQSGPFSHCPDAARSDNDSAKTTGTIGLVVGALGGAALAAGVVLLATGGNDSQAGRLRVTPVVGATGGGVVFLGTL